MGVPLGSRPSAAVDSASPHTRFAADAQAVESVVVTSSFQKQSDDNDEKVHYKCDNVKNIWQCSKVSKNVVSRQEKFAKNQLSPACTGNR
ncbi:unnamed protein product [Angiostrongylus costaricensis]|uniref:Uncharacterized protein n=1 Tax=Angiostrongylus costaricensis TaxID=334426 RepID=A0A0R3PSN1_ANGCS|nr:unnamed protein product [Angiostrongylus costaricensis]